MKSGTLGAQAGKEKIVVPAGGTAVFAAGTHHKWWNAGDDLLEFSGQAIPAVDLDRFLQGVFAVLNASPNGRPSIFYIAHVLWRHRNSQLIATPPKPSSASFSLSFCSSGASWANTADRVGPVHPSRVPVRRLWTPERLGVRCRSARISNKSAVLGSGWRGAPGWSAILHLLFGGSSTLRQAVIQDLTRAMTERVPRVLAHAKPP